MVVKVSKEDFVLETKDMISYLLVIIKGSFTIKNLVSVRKAITEALEISSINMVFDLSGCKEMDSS